MCLWQHVLHQNMNFFFGIGFLNAFSLINHAWRFLYLSWEEVASYCSFMCRMCSLTVSQALVECWHAHEACKKLSASLVASFLGGQYLQKPCASMILRLSSVFGVTLIDCRIAIDGIERFKAHELFTEFNQRMLHWIKSMIHKLGFPGLRDDGSWRGSQWSMSSLSLCSSPSKGGNWVRYSLNSTNRAKNSMKFRMRCHYRR